MKLKKITISMIIVLAIFFVSIGFVNAEDSKLKSYGSFTKSVASLTNKGGTSLTKKATTGNIPAEYSYFGFFKLRKDSPKAEYNGVKAVPSAVKKAWSKYGSDKTPYQSTFASGVVPTLAKKGYTVCFPKVAIYNNKWIDVKGEITDYEANKNSAYKGNLKPTIAFYGNNSSGKVSVVLQAVNWANVKWSFLEYNASAKSGAHCKGKPISVKGNTSYWDVDYQQGIHIKGDTMKKLYISDNSNKLKYGTISSKLYVFDSANTNTNGSNKKYAFTELFVGNSITRTYSFYRIKDGLARGGIEMGYNSVNKVIPSNPTKSQSTNKLVEGSKQEYKVKQAIPFQDKSNYNKSVVLQDTLDNCFDMSNSTAKVIRVSDGKVMSGNGNYFSVSKTGQTFKATATTAALKTEAFYGETYELVITTKIKNGYDFSKYSKDSKGYIVKNQGSSIVDGTTRKTTVTTSYYNPPICKYQYSKYYNKKGQIVSKTAYELDCNEHCKKVGDKYYNDVGALVSKEDYYDKCIIPTPITSPTKETSASLIRYNKEFKFKITQDVPHVTSSNYYKTFVISDTLEPPLKISDKSKIKITQIDRSTNKETDYTNKFDIKLEGQMVILSLKDTSDDNFYGTRDNNDIEAVKSYIVTLPIVLKENVEKEIDMNKYLNDGRYVIPNTAKTTVTKKDDSKEEKDTNKVEVNYYENPIPTKTVNYDDITEVYNNKGTYTYTIEKSVLEYQADQYYSSFEFQDKFEDCINIKKESSLVIKNNNNEDVTKWFDISINGQTLRAKLKDEYNNSGFYGHVYKFLVTVSIKPSYSLDKYKKDKKYIIPNEASFIYDGKQVIKTNIVEVKIDVPEPEKKLVPNASNPVSIASLVLGLIIAVLGGYAIYTKIKKA